MFTENGLVADLDEVHKVIRQADVLGIGFFGLRERLLIDPRTNKQDGPYVGVVEPLTSVQERMFWLGQHRPRFRMPQRFAFFFWPNSVRFLEESGVWSRLRALVEQERYPSAPHDADRALATLHRLERQALYDALTGEGYRTLWERT